MNLKLSVFALAAFVSSASISTAFADCNNLWNNSEWNTNFDKLQTQVDKGNYDDALNTAKVLFAICPTSPALNYFTGMAMKGKGDKDRAALYFTKASEYTTDFAVDPGMARRIWYERYESEYPEASPERIQAKIDELKKLQDENKAHKEQAAEKESESYKSQKIAETETHLIAIKGKKEWRNIMLSGIGVGVGGIGMAIAGGVMVGQVDKLKYEGNASRADNKLGYKITNEYIAGWTLLGAGITLGVAGTILAIVGGYEYSRIKVGDSAELGLNVAPSSVSFDLTF